MAFRCISQVALPATTETSLISGSQLENYYVKSIVVCNRGATNATFRLRLRLVGEAAADKQYLFYDLPVLANDTYRILFDIGLIPGDILLGYASTANLSVQIFAE